MARVAGRKSQTGDGGLAGPLQKETGRPQIEYEAAVEEAICFGWIDGKIRKLDEARYARLFTPRKPRSTWSRINIERARRMIKEGKMTASGIKGL